MQRRLHILIVLVLAFSLVLSGAGVARAGATAQATPPPAIKLRAGTIIPGQVESVTAAAALTISGYAPGEAGYYIVQFTGAVQEAWKSQVAAIGVELLDYLPDFAFKVRMTPEQANAVGQMPNVNWVGLFQPAYKIDPSVTLGGTRLYRLRVEQGSDAAQVAQAIASLGAVILNQDNSYLLVAADATQLIALANILDVAWIENFAPKVKHGEYGAGVILGANAANAAGYDGSSQTAAVADTGFGTGVAATAHADVPASRIVALQNFAGASSSGCYNVIDDGVQDVDSGHGTHVALSVLGDGGATGEGKGTAPAARLVFQAVENYVDFTGICALYNADGYYLIGIPDNMGDLFLAAYNAGARIHSNSWGSAAAGDYTLDSANTDTFVWGHKDMLITFSAGNEGTDANSNGVVDNDSIGSPATAKNVLTVGASENDRSGNYACDTGLGYVSHDAYQSGQTCSSMGGQNLLGTYGGRWGADFPAAPLSTDLTAGNKEQMAGFSSRGPTDDGRIKPDVVAPGTWVLSGYSDFYQEGYGDPLNPRNGLYQVDGWGMPINSRYKYFGGTSMSNPIAAGAATVVRDFYQKAYSHAASAALVKASLINSAVDLLDENNDGANDNDFPIPNVHEGWGRVNLVGATAITQFIDNAAGVGTSGVASNQYAVNGGSPFKVSLVWTDYPSSETAAQNLVNDLDLTVTSPTGAVYRGNVFAGGWSQTGGSADRVNNVENVFVQSPAAGNWTVAVRGFNVPNGPQPFALVVSGAGTSTPDNPPTVSITAPANGATVSGSVNVTAAASDDNGVTQVEFFVDGASIGVDTTAPYAATWNTTAVGNGGHTLTARATDTANQTTTSAAVNVTVANVVPDNPPTVSITAPANGATVSGSVSVAATASDDYGVTQVEFFVGGVSIGVDTTAPYGVTWNTTSVANGSHTLTARATDTANQTTTSAAVNVTVNNSTGNVLYVSSASGGTVGGVAFSDEDILRFDPATAAWTMFFDGSDVGLGSSNKQDIDAFDILADGSILLSIVDAATIPNVGSIDDSDIVRFVPTSLGSTTAGTFAWYFDGSDVGLSTNNEDVDAVDLLADGRLLVSTLGSFSVAGAAGGDTDLLVFTPSTTGANTSGTWALYFDGSDVGLADSSTEDVGGAWVNDANGDIYLSAVGAFSVAGAAGDGADVFICHPSSLGNNTACTFGPGLYWDGSANGFAGQVVDGVALTAASVGSGVRQLDGNLTPEDAANRNTFDDVEDEIESTDEVPDEAGENTLFLPAIIR